MGIHILFFVLGIIFGIIFSWLTTMIYSKKPSQEKIETKKPSIKIQKRIVPQEQIDSDDVFYRS